MAYVFQQAAADDLGSIAEFLHAERPDAADRFLDAVESLLELLSHMPTLGATYNEEKFAGLRWKNVPGFRKFLVFYDQTTNGIRVIRILHGERDIPSVLED